MPAPHTHPRCILCHRAGKQSCSGCGTQYCSDECRDTGQHAHEILCSSLSKFNTAPPVPDAKRRWTFRRSILFPADADKPQFFWLKCSPVKPYEFNDAKDYLESVQHRIAVRDNEARGKTFNHTIEIMYGAGSAHGGSLMNKSIAAATGSSADEHGWRGNVIVMRHEGPGQEL
ncbi:hypothetical protein AJ80_04112 [Polytolypa hystricis UAMH7299]|uniref:Suppressor of anucleate metulae protein B n=1 Tax=Polytolypa hystricis (strain UAMH7299) TaxID=1447883 RepID=A0A2B7YF60_POLH7|nr:hypothetical protein AJ80_04112 [Polytolypa hystricis UAMH7299]